MTPRQMRLVAGPADVCNQGGQSMLREEEAPYAFDSKDARRSQKARLQRYLSLMKEEGLEGSSASAVPSWQSKIVKGTPERCATTDNSTIIDTSFAESERDSCSARNCLQQVPDKSVEDLFARAGGALFDMTLTRH
jgi:hypothetical protein